MNNLNKTLEKYNLDYRSSLVELIYSIENFDESDRGNLLFNLGGVLNHNLYWKSMNDKRELPSGKLKNKIKKKYGGYESFWQAFKSKALSLKGSGYTFLVLKEEGEIDIINTSNQDTPFLIGYIPLFNIDLWERAYYINYENNKEAYIDNFEKIACFENASRVYEKLIK